MLQTVVLLASSLFTCTAPDELVVLDIPNGDTATREELLAVVALVQDHARKVEAYLACLDRAVHEELRAAASDLYGASHGVRQAAFDRVWGEHVDKHNAAFDKLKELADAVNAEVVKFNAAAAARRKTAEPGPADTK
jgi:hypothetical protein